MTPKEKLQTHSVLTNYRDGIQHQHVLQTTLAGINRGIVKAVLCLSICLLFTACSSDSSIATEATTQSPRPPTKEPATIVSREPNPATEGTVGALARSYIVALSEDIGERVAGSPEEAAAAEYIASTLQSFGYLPEIQIFSQDNLNGGDKVASANVIAVKEGLSQKTIIVGAHYDSVPDAKGAGDNASGVAVMLETAKMLKDVETAYNIYFVAFGAEEVGLIGSRYYVKQMTK